MLSVEQRFLERLLPPVGGRDVVDLGCGTGRWLTVLAPCAPRSLIGLDSSAEMLSQAARKLDGRAILLKGSCQAPPFEAASADLVLCSFVLSYISNIDLFAEQLRRIARPSADIFITDLHPETERKFGWRRGFRDRDADVAIRTRWRSLASIVASFEEQGIHPVALLEPRFGDPEFQILDGAGKADLTKEVGNEPVIYVLQLRPIRIPAGHARTVTGTKGVASLGGSRLALGPTESTLARLELTNGRIAAIHSEPSQGHSPRGARLAADLTGFLIIPGLINAHDHLEFALFPRLGKGEYRNFTQWANDIHQPTVSPIREHRAVPKAARLWWGAIRNLLCGVTTVCHHNPYVPEVFDGEFPLRVLRDFGWAHSIPMEPDFARKQADTPPKHPFILHLGEGTDASSAGELFDLDRAGALTARTVVVHGLALNEDALLLLKERGAGLVWCPSSNVFLFGRTHSRERLRVPPRVALGSDSSLTARGDLLDEVQFARDMVGLTAGEVYAQVTVDAARVLHLGLGEGSLRVGALADLIAIRDKDLTPAETLARSTYRDVELVIVGGRVQLASSRCKEELQPELTEGLERLKVDGHVRWIRAPVAKLFEDTRRVLGHRLTMNGRLLDDGSA
jgi:cytosine/adenosine deaminase-related metal-dependent hydrolase/SAM-dependent methyltransferase